jgi:hypothetical protein
LRLPLGRVSFALGLLHRVVRGGHRFAAAEQLAQPSEDVLAFGRLGPPAQFGQVALAEEEARVFAGLHRHVVRNRDPPGPFVAGIRDLALPLGQDAACDTSSVLELPWQRIAVELNIRAYFDATRRS